MIWTKHNRLKNLNWQEAGHLAIYKHDWELEPELTRVYQETTPAFRSERDLQLKPRDLRILRPAP